MDVEVLISSSALVTESIFKNRNLSRYEILRTYTLNNNNKKILDAPGIIYGCFGGYFSTLLKCSRLRWFLERK